MAGIAENKKVDRREWKRNLLVIINLSVIFSIACTSAGMGRRVEAAPVVKSDSFSAVVQTEDSEAALHAVEMLPRPGSSDVDPEAAVVVTFDQPVVPLTDDQTQLPAAFTIQPKAKGRAEWLNTSTYIFYPDLPLTGGVDYLVTLNTGLTSTTGASLASGKDEIREWSFRTAAPRLESVSPDGTKGTIDLDQEFQLEFNQRMDPNSVQRNLSLQDGSGRKTALTFSWEANNTLLTITPAQLLARDTEYTLALRGEALSAGGTPLGESLAQEYITVPILDVEALPTYEIRPKGNHYSFFLHMTAPLDPYQDLGDLVQISPAGIFVESSISQYYDVRAIYIGGFFEPNQSYTVTLSGSLKDRWGQPIAGEKQFTFRTAPTPSRLDIPMMRSENVVTFMPGETHFFVEVNNINSIHFNSAQLSLEDFILDSSKYGLEERVSGLDLNTRQVEVDTPADRYTVVELPLQENGEALDTGLYYYHLQSPQVEGPLYVSIPFLAVVSPLSMTMKRSVRDVFLWVVDLRDQTPLSGKQVSFYGEEKDIIGTAITAEDGSGMVTLPEEFDVSGPVYAVIGQPGDPDFGLVTDDWEIGGYMSPRDGMRQVYLYTDRPIYRPGQTVNFRVVMRDEDGGEYALPPSGQVSVRMLSGFNLYTYREEIDIIDLELSSYGTAAGAITLPDDAVPGYYTLDVLGERGGIEFQVANYRKPEIDVQVTFEKDDWQVGEDLTANVLAEYYFGAPAGDVNLTWTLYGRKARFDPGDGYRAGGQLTNRLSFNDEGDYYYYSDFGSWITDGTAKTDANGAFAIQINNQDILERISAENLYSLTLEVTIQDEEEMPLSVHDNANLHPAPFYIGLRAENWVGQAGKEAGFSVLTTDWQKEISGEHILHAQFQKITWEQAKTVGWSLERHLPVFTTVSSADLSTDEKGRARLSFVPPEPGMYALKVFGEGAVSQYLLWVTGSQRTRWPSFPDQTLVLTADKELYQPGDEARIFIPNPFGGKNLALITIEREKVLYSEVVEIEGSSYEWELPLTDEHAPNVFVTVTLLGEQSEGVPSFYYGKTELAVEPVSKILEVDILTSPEQTEPGGEVTFDIQVRDSEGKPVQGEFSLAVVDKAVLALAEEDGPDILEAFYSPRNLRVVSSLSLKIAATRTYETDLNGIGGGGGGEEDIKIPHVREHFEDTALWLGSVETNASGIATVQMVLPDNLTTWVADLRGVTRDTKVGSASSEIVVSKPLLIRPQTPRFFVAGDHTALSAVVHNTTDQKLTVDVVLRSKGIVLDKGMHSEQQVVLAAGARETITWWGTIQDVDEVELVFVAQSGDLQDVTRPAQGTLPVLRYQVPASYVTAGMLTGSGEQLETVQLPTTFTPVGGDLEIELSPSLAASMVGDQEVLEVHSRDFTENIVSHMLQSLMLYDFAEQQGAEYGEAKDELQGEVEVSLARLLREQNLDGGWGWMAEKDSDAYISTYALFGLWRAQKAGFHLPPEKFEAATRYAATAIISPNAEKLSWQMDREVFREYVLHLVKDFPLPNIEKLYAYRDELSPWSLALLALMVDEIEVGEQPDNDMLSMDKSDGQQLLNDLEGMAIRSASGAHWEETGENRFYNFSTVPFNTAVAVYALAQINPASPLVRDGVRYLVSQMRSDGRWASGYETTWVLMALMEAMEASSDFNPQYGYEVNLNGQTLLSGEMEDSGLDTLSISVLLEDLQLEGLNELKISRDDGSGTLYYRALLNLERPAEAVEAEQHGVSISRSYYGVGEDCTKAGCPMIDSVSPGTYSGMAEVRLVLTLPTEMSSLVVEDFIPAGMEISDSSLKISKAERMPAYWDLPAPEDEYDPRNPFAEGWGWWYFSQPQVYDDHLRWIGRQVPAGTYVLIYRIQAVRPGEYRVLPAQAYEYYFPDVRGNSAGQVFTVE